MNMHDIQIPPCEAHHFRPSIKMASSVVGVDLENPIDVSQMTVHECSVLPVKNYRGMVFHRKTELRAFDDDEEIIIEITRISQKRPKIEKQ